tara:strand:+ start:2562 stop:2951 length:390 start_codon:yes stop_codon:yes gene_type:complete
MNIRHADAVRDHIRSGALPEYKPAVSWQEDQQPFTDVNESIIYCRQEGRPVDAFVRQVSVTIYVFSKAGATNADMSALYSDAVTALEYAKGNPNVSDDLKITVSNDVSGELYTGQNRRYYTFQVLCYSS